MLTEDIAIFGKFPGIAFKPWCYYYYCEEIAKIIDFFRANSEHCMSFFQQASILWGPHVMKVKIAGFRQKRLFVNSFWTKEAGEITQTSSCFFRRDASRQIHVALERTKSKYVLRSMPREVTWWSKQSCCMSVDMSLRENHIGIIPNVYLFSIKSQGQKRLWHHMTSNDPKEKPFGQNCIWTIDTGGLINIRYCDNN